VNNYQKPELHLSYGSECSKLMSSTLPLSRRWVTHSYMTVGLEGFGCCIPLVLDCPSLLLRASKAHSAASMPVFMALWLPFTLTIFMKPGLHPISAPPGNTRLGRDWWRDWHHAEFRGHVRYCTELSTCIPPSLRALAP